MKLAGTAFLALWNGVQPEALADYEDWHSREHVPERLTVPGILAAWRYRDVDEARAGFFTLYDLADAQVPETAAYQRLVSHPTPASARMRPLLRDVVRIVCRLDAAAAGPDGRFVAPRIVGSGAPLLVVPAGVRLQSGAIDTNAAGHPLAGARPAPGQVLLVEGDDENAVRTAANDGSGDGRLFGLIEAVARIPA